MKAVTVTLAGEDRLVRITRRKRQKRIYVRALADGSLNVSAPKNTPFTLIRQVLREGADEVEGLPVYMDPRKRLEEARTIPVFGRDTPVCRCLPAGASVAHDEEGARLLVPAEPTQGAKALHDFFRRQLLAEAEKAKEELAERFPEVAAVPFRFSCRYMKQTLGSYRKNPPRISLNLCLVHYPPAFLRLIVSHEITHHFHQDHSRAFHATLERYFPGERKKHAELKRVHDSFLYRRHDKPSAL